MKVMFFAPLAVLSYHFETDLELMKKHQDAGDELIVINCSGDLKKTGFNGCKGYLRCQYCHSKSKQGLELLGVPSKNIFTIDLKNHLHNEERDFKDMQTLKNYTYKGCDVGMAVASTLVSNVRDPEPDLSKIKTYIKNAVNTTCAEYDYLDHFLDTQNPDLIYFFNGRFSMYNPLLRLAQKKNIQFFVHERAGVLNRYSLSEKTSPHDLNYIKKSIRESVSNTSNEQIEKIGGPWFTARINKAEESWYSFVTKQKQGKLPQGFDKIKKNIAIFISSEEEFECVAGWENHLFKNQKEAVEFIKEKFEKRDDYHFYLRLHPNLAGINNTQTQYYKKFHANNMTVIHAEDPIDTYELIKNVQKTISFGSTVGIEASYWGTPSIVAGRAFFEELDSVYIPKTKDELSQLIEAKLQPNNPLGATKYSYWMKNWGAEFEYFKPKNLSSGLFLGKSLRGNEVLMYFGYFFYFLMEVYAVLTGKMSAHTLKSKIKNKL
jgi:hypothetical protein